jgi:hypothetical protein
VQVETPSNISGQTVDGTKEHALHLCDTTLNPRD